MQTKTFRMTLKTYKRIKSVFPAKRNELAADYFERLVEYMEVNLR